MILIDTHTHLYLDEFDADRDEMIQRALGQGVERLYLPNVDQRTIEGMLQLEATYPGHCFPMMGLHPCSVGDDVEAELAVVEGWLRRRHFCAVGEIGLDYYWDLTFVDQQKEAFRRQIRWAKEFQIPIIIHSRDATDDCIALVREEKDEQLRGIFHCFGGSLEQARAIQELDFFLGIGGVLTFKKAGLDVVLKDVPLSALVLETDSPYLAPVPYRSKRNESAYLRLVAEKLAEVKGVSVEEVAEITTSNANRMMRYE